MSSRMINALVLILLCIAVSSCAGTMRSSPKKEKARNLERLGNSLVMEGDVREGLARLLEAEELDPGNPDIQHEIAIVYQKIDQFDLSLQHFKKAIRIKSDFPEAYNNMGILYFKKGDHENAIKCFKKAVSDVLYRTPHFAYRNMGLVYFEKKDYSRAIESYNKAISEAPEYVDAYYDLAKAYEVLGENDKAILIYDKIIKQAPESLMPYLEQAKIYKITGQIDKSVEKLNYIIGTDPRNPVARDAIKLLEEIKPN